MLGLGHKPEIRVMHFTAKPPELMDMDEIGLVIPDAAFIGGLNASPEAAETLPPLSVRQKAVSKAFGEKALINAHRKNLIRGLDRNLGEIAGLLEVGLDQSAHGDVARTEEMAPAGHENGDISLALGLEQGHASKVVTVQLRSTPDGGKQTLDKYRFTQYGSGHPTTLAVDRFGRGAKVKGVRRTSIEKLPLVSNALAYGLTEAGLKTALSAREDGNLQVKGGMLWF